MLVSSRVIRLRELFLSSNRLTLSKTSNRKPPMAASAARALRISSTMANTSNRNGSAARVRTVVDAISIVTTLLHVRNIWKSICFQVCGHDLAAELQVGLLSHYGVFLPYNAIDLH